MCAHQPGGTSVSGDLPLDPAAFAGRTAELSGPARALGSSRLVTVGGVGGVGGVGTSRLAARGPPPTACGASSRRRCAIRSSPPRFRGGVRADGPQRPAATRDPARVSRRAPTPAGSRRVRASAGRMRRPGRRTAAPGARPQAARRGTPAADRGGRAGVHAGPLGEQGQTHRRPHRGGGALQQRGLPRVALRGREQGRRLDRQPRPLRGDRPEMRLGDGPSGEGVRHGARLGRDAAAVRALRWALRGSPAGGVPAPRGPVRFTTAALAPDTHEPAASPTRKGRQDGGLRGGATAC